MPGSPTTAVLDVRRRRYLEATAISMVETDPDLSSAIQHALAEIDRLSVDVPAPAEAPQPRVLYRGRTRPDLPGRSLVMAFVDVPENTQFVVIEDTETPAPVETIHAHGLCDDTCPHRSGADG